MEQLRKTITEMESVISARKLSPKSTVTTKIEQLDGKILITKLEDDLLQEAKRIIASENSDTVSTKWCIADWKWVQVVSKLPNGTILSCMPSAQNRNTKSSKPAIIRHVKKGKRKKLAKNVESLYCAHCQKELTAPCSKHPYTYIADSQGTASENEPESSTYTWEYTNIATGKPGFIDGSDEMCSNWLRYINHSKDPNMCAFQWNNHVWYMSTVPILAGTELFVSYGKEYANHLASTVPFKSVSRLSNKSSSHRQEIHRCSHCDNTFSTKSYLMQHQCKHLKKEWKHRCDICLVYTSQWRSRIERHIRNVHLSGEKPFKCDICNGRKAYKRMAALNDHLLTVHMGLYACRCHICGAMSRTATVLKHHIDSVHKKIRRYICELCGAKFANTGNLKRHKLGHTQQTCYQCDVCNVRLANRGHLQLHILYVHIRLKNVQCDLCAKMFSCKGKLTEHMLVHTEKRDYTCSHCPAAFKQRGHQIQHEKSVHTKKRPFGCSECSIRFEEYAHLKVHMRSHTGEKPYACMQCDHRFATPGNRSRHVDTVHSKARPHACSQCSKAFKSIAALQVHFRSHTGEKPYPCTQCYLRFSSHSGRAKHTHYVHTGDRPHACSQCSKAFKTISDLKHHLRVHTGEKPYPCAKCNLKFSSSGNRAKHVRRAHSEVRSYACNECSKAFKAFADLKEHLRVHTGEKPYHCTKCSRKFSNSGSRALHVRRAHSEAKPLAVNVEKHSKVLVT